MSYIKKNLWCFASLHWEYFLGHSGHLTLCVPLGHHTASWEECFLFDCLTSHDIILQFTVRVYSRVEQTSRSEHFRLAKVLVETILRTKKNPRNKHFGRERVNFGKVPPFRTVHYGLLSPATGFGLQIWQIFLAKQETSKTLPLIAPTMLPSQDKANGDSIQQSGTDNVEVVNSKVS